jgi:hypothetical protein
MGALLFTVLIAIASLGDADAADAAPVSIAERTATGK